MNLLSRQKNLSQISLTLARAAFYVLVILIPFRYRIPIEVRQYGSIYADYTDFLLFGHDIALLLMLLFWGFGKWIRREGLSTNPSLLSFTLAAFTLLIGISALFSIDRDLSIYHFVRALLLFGLYLYILDQVESVSGLVPLLLIQVFVQSIPALFQFSSQSDVGLQIAGEYLLNPDWAGVSVVMSEGANWLRAYGLSDHPNILGGSLALAILILVGDYFNMYKKGNFVLPVIIVLGSSALLVTFSRSAALALILGAAFIAYFALRQWRLKVLPRFITLGLLIVLGMLPVFLATSKLIGSRLSLLSNEDISPFEVQSIGERAILAEASISIFEKNPILGVGYGALPQAISRHFPEFETYYQPAHFVLITAAAETGILGTTAYALALFGPWTGFVAGKWKHPPFGLIIVSASFIAITLIGFLDYYPWSLTPGRIWMYLIWGIWAVEYRQLKRPHNV